MTTAAVVGTPAVLTSSTAGPVAVATRIAITAPGLIIATSVAPASVSTTVAVGAPALFLPVGGGRLVLLVYTPAPDTDPGATTDPTLIEDGPHIAPVYPDLVLLS